MERKGRERKRRRRLDASSRVVGGNAIKAGARGGIAEAEYGENFLHSLIYFDCRSQFHYFLNQHLLSMKKKMEKRKGKEWKKEEKGGILKLKEKRERESEGGVC